MAASRRGPGATVRSKVSAPKSSTKSSMSTPSSSGQRRDYMKDVLKPQPESEDASFGMTGMTGES